MKILAALALGLLAMRSGGAQEFKFDNWKAWDSFKEGSSVEFEIETSGMKMTMIKTLDKKEKEEITLKNRTKMKVGDSEIDNTTEEKVKKTESTGGEDVTCPLCEKPAKDHKDTGKWSDEKVKVGEQEVKCKLYESPEKACNGETVPKTKIWYSSDVPGHMVKMETEQMKMTAVKFEVKK
ncbi:MAG: hypothetical protein HYY17_00090 [Planctomycetes bacterium]|nr:hypothetical protein [Planctomycetota bacterium]